MSDTAAKFLIIGAGPTGLGAAWRLNELGRSDWLLLERSSSAGGLAGSVIDEQGFTWDLGGHVLFSHYAYFDQVLDRCLGDEWVHHQREAWVFLRGQFIPYPLQNNIWRLPAADLVRCLDGLLSVHNKPALPLRSDSLEDWILRNFGAGLADVFFFPYNKKVWAYQPNRLSACWIQDRVAMVDLSRVLRNLVLRQDDLGWGPNSTFRYPLRGGTGVIWQRLLAQLPQQPIRFGCEVVSVDANKRRVELTDGSFVSYEYLLTSVPLNKFLANLSGEPALTENLHRFLSSSTNLIGIGLAGTPPPELKTKSWIYFVEEEFPFYRCTVFSNYSKYNVAKPGEQWSLLCETSESQDQHVDQTQLLERTINALMRIGLIAQETEIVDRWQKRIEYGYPTPFLGRDALLQPIDDGLRAINIFSRGRFGAWKYEVSNQDHSFMQGVEAVDHVLLGSEETTYNHPAIVNAGKRDARRVPAT